MFYYFTVEYVEKGVTTAAGQGLNDKCEVGLYNCENVSLLLFSAPRSKQSFYNIRKEDLVSKLGCMRRICKSCHRTINYET